MRRGTVNTSGTKFPRGFPHVFRTYQSNNYITLSFKTFSHGTTNARNTRKGKKQEISQPFLRFHTHKETWMFCPHFLCSLFSHAHSMQIFFNVELKCTYINVFLLKYVMRWESRIHKIEKNKHLLYIIKERRIERAKSFMEAFREKRQTKRSKV